MMNMERADCETLDRDDPLREMRHAFDLPEGIVYLDGNSLGALPRAAAQRARDVVDEQWGRGLVGSWNAAGWWDLPSTLGDKVARLIGADAGEVVVTDSTGINLYKVLSAALSLRPSRRVVVLEGSNFPTDNYIAQGLIEQLGDGYEIRFAEEAELLNAIDERVAAVCLTDIHYKSGRALDIPSLTAAIHEAGAIAIWDICHSAGVLELEMNAWQVDFAVGCSYKYLNGGPGAPGFVFAARRHQGRALQPLSGWWSHAAPFEFERDYRPAEDARQMLSGTQPILSLAVAEIGIDLALSNDPAAVREKSRRLTGLFIDLVEQRCREYGFDLITPRDADRRGSQVAFNHPAGYAIIQALIARGVIGDFRAPTTMRFGFAPLYVSYCDVWDAVDALHGVMVTEEWRGIDGSPRGGVT